MFVLPNPLFFLEFQIDHYKYRLANAYEDKEIIFLSKELRRLKLHLITLLN